MIKDLEQLGINWERIREMPLVNQQPMVMSRKNLDKLLELSMERDAIEQASVCGAGKISHVKEFAPSLIAMEKQNEVNLLREKLNTLKQIVLLAHPSVEKKEMNDLSLKQWQVFITEYPDEGPGDYY